MQIYEKYFVIECIVILLFSFFLSLIITIFYVWQVYKVNDFDVDSVAQGILWFVGIYIVLICIDEEQENIDKLENKSLKNIIKVVMKIKTFLIKGLVSKETKKYKEFIKLKIKTCINNNSDFIAILIICIDENAFGKKTLRDEFRDELKDLNAELVDEYNNKKFTLEESLVDFFTKDLIRYNFSYLEILEFIDNVEKRIGLYNKHEINSKLDRLKPYNKPLPKLKEQDIEDIGKLVNDVFQAFDSVIGERIN